MVCNQGVEAHPASTAGDVRLGISNSIVRLYREYYGRGPKQAKTYLLEDLVICVMRGGGIPVERTLTDSGRADLVKEVRHAFQVEERDRFTEIVEEYTGRPV